MTTIITATVNTTNYVMHNTYEPVMVSQETCEQAAKRLNDILTVYPGWKGTVKGIFDIFNQTIGITCGNYLPWSTSFQKGAYFSFDEQSLGAPAQWGIGSHSRPFIAFKYEIEDENAKTTQGVSALFQRYSPQSGSMMHVHGHHSAAGGQPSVLDMNYFKGTLEEYYDSLREFFKGNVVDNPLYLRGITKINLVKD